MLSDQKQAIRAECRMLRRSLGESFRQQAGLEICARIEAWEVFQKAGVILTYMPIKAEADLRPLLERHPGKRWVLPRIAPEQDHAMYFHPYRADRLVRHPFGMDEPDAALPLVAPGEIELVLVPGLAYDRRGWRLGYGGGYYDRFLRGFKGTTLGVTYETLLFDSLPHGDFDVQVGWFATEAGVVKADSDR